MARLRRASARQLCSRFASSEGWWSRWVTLPHQPACRAGALLVCHDPKWQVALVLPQVGRVGDRYPDAGRWLHDGEILGYGALVDIAIIALLIATVSRRVGSSPGRSIDRDPRTAFSASGGRAWSTSSGKYPPSLSPR